MTMCAPVVQGYGLTETCAGSFISVPDISVSLSPHSWLLRRREGMPMQHLCQSVCLPSASAGPDCCSAAWNRLPGLALYCAEMMECLTLMVSDALPTSTGVCPKTFGSLVSTHG